MAADFLLGRENVGKDFRRPRHLTELSAPAIARERVPPANLALPPQPDKLEVPGGRSAAERYGELVACTGSGCAFCES